jgi:hypothetical protein
MVRREKHMNYTFVLPMAALAACAVQPPQIAKTAPFPPKFETWAPQEVATNVQDWDRAAVKIVDGLQNNGLLMGQNGQLHNDLRVSQLTSTATDATTGLPTFEQNLVGMPSRGHAFSVKLAHNSVFLRQLKGAVENEVIGRGGPAADMNIDLTVDVVSWGSRLHSQPYKQRCEAVWQATVTNTAGDKIMSFREPFYIFAYDVGLYAQLPPPPPSPDEELRSSARPLRYTTN